MKVFGGLRITNDHIEILQFLFTIAFRAGFSGKLNPPETTIFGATHTSLLPNKIRNFTFNNTSKVDDPCSVIFV